MKRSIGQEEKLLVNLLKGMQCTSSRLQDMINALLLVFAVNPCIQNHFNCGIHVSIEAAAWCCCYVETMNGHHRRHLFSLESTV